MKKSYELTPDAEAERVEVIDVPHVPLVVSETAPTPRNVESALKTLREAIDNPELPDEVRDLLVQVAYAVEGLGIQVARLNNDVKAVNDKLIAFTEQALILQQQELDAKNMHRERVNRTLDNLDRELDKM